MPDATLVDNKTTFSSFSHILDARILRALADLGFAKPTLVQTKAIPFALENRDILARARTGSGKTAAYCIPLVQKILNAKLVSRSFPCEGQCAIPGYALFSSLYHCGKQLISLTLFSIPHHQNQHPKLLVRSSWSQLANCQSKCLHIFVGYWRIATRMYHSRTYVPVRLTTYNGQ